MMVCLNIRSVRVQTVQRLVLVSWAELHGGDPTNLFNAKTCSRKVKIHFNYYFSQTKDTVSDLIQKNDKMKSYRYTVNWAELAYGQIVQCQGCQRKMQISSTTLSQKIYIDAYRNNIYFLVGC